MSFKQNDLQDLKDDPKDHKSHSCKYCKKPFKNFKSFQKHEDAHVCIRKGVYPKLVMKRLSSSLTHPYKCTKCKKRFHKIYEAKEHYITTHQNSKDSKRVCRCGSPKRKVRCKKCEGCLAQKCNQCQFCLKPSMKKSCVKRECHYQVVLASCMEAFRQVCLKKN